MHIFVINGQGGIGKDQFIIYVKEYLNEHGIQVYNISSVDKVKQAAYILGFDGEKDEKGREFLFKLKTLSTNYYNGPLRYIQTEIDGLSKNCVVFVHIREPEEIDKFKQVYTDSKTILIFNDTKTRYNNYADDFVDKYIYDFYIPNKNTLSNLKDKAKQFCQDCGIIRKGE